MLNRSGATGCVRAALAAAALALAAPAHATIMKFMTVEELAAVSTDVVRGTVLGQVSRWTEDREGILTYVDVVVHERLRGGRPLPPVVQIVQPGGELDGTRMLVIGLPAFREGEEVILFLAPYSDDPAEADHVVLLGGKMGKMRVLPDPAGGEPVAVRELGDVEFAEFVEDRGRPRLDFSPAPNERSIPLTELRSRVLAAAAPAGAPARGRP